LIASKKKRSMRLEKSAKAEQEVSAFTSIDLEGKDALEGDARIDMRGSRKSERGLLAEKGQRDLCDFSKLTFYSRNAIKWARKFSWDKTAEEFACIIRKYTDQSTREFLERRA